MQRNPLLIGQVEEVDLLPPTVRDMMATPGVYILGDTQRPDFTFVLAVLSPGKAHFMSPDADAINPERFLPTVTLHGPYRAGEDVLAALAAARARLEEVEVACAQAVEFATYVEEHAKGKMEDAARRFMSMEFAQELAGVLKAGREAQAKAADIAKFQQALDEAGNKTLKVLSAEFIGNELSGTVADVHNVHHVGAIFSERRTLADFAKLLVSKASPAISPAREGG